MSNNDTNNVKNETDDSCPPGMKFDGDSGKCVAIGGGEENFKKEEDNAGNTSAKGTDMPPEADATQVPSATHDCPPGTTFNADTGSCEPTGDNAGQVGGGGAGAAETPGKEFYKAIEKLMASHSDYNTKLVEKITSVIENKNSGVSAESASFGGFRSSKVSGQSPKALWESTVARPAKWFESAKAGTLTGDQGFTSWRVSLEQYIAQLKKQWLAWGQQGAPQAIKGEAFTISAGDMPQVFSKQVYLIPGGRMRVPIRQFLDTQIITDADRYNWYKVSGFDFDDGTAEGTAPTEEAQTVTKVPAIPALVRAYIKVNYSDIENAPFDLIEAFNRAAGLGAIDAEAKEILDTIYNAAGNLSNTNWVNGNTGADLSGAPGADDVAGMSLTQTGIYAAKRAIENQGGDTSPGSLVGFFHPKAIEDLLVDTADSFFTGQNPLHSTALGVLENRLGMDFVVSNRCPAIDNTTNDTYRNVVMMKGTIGLAVAADLQIEAQRRPDLSAVNVGARHRLKGAIIDETMTCRVSTAQ